MATHGYSSILASITAHQHMKTLHILLLAITSILASCGPSEKELRTELREIDSKLTAINFEAKKYRAQMNQAEIEVFFGAFAAGYGATSGDYGLAVDGYNTATQATRQHDFSSYSLDQLRSRQQKLLKRRTEILDKLK